jgi:hypothetical protein
MNAPSFNYVASQPWTPEQDAILRARYPTEGVKLAPELGRTKESLCARAFRLGLRVVVRHRHQPKPQAVNYVALGVRSGKALEPVAPEVERAAIEAFMAAREVTQCPTMYAAGGECIQHIGNKAGVNRGARKL